MDPVEVARHVARRKTIHVEIPSEIHSDLRVALCNHGNLSVQAVVREVAIRIANGDPLIFSMLDDMLERRYSGDIKNISRTDTEALFNILERASPLSTGR